MRSVVTLLIVFVNLSSPDGLAGEPKPAAKKKPAPVEPPYPPTLPGGKTIVTDCAPEFLKPTETLKPGVAIAKTAPTVDFMYYPGQTYPGKPWSNWGDSITANGKYYASIGDHLAPIGNAFVFEYDPTTKTLKQLVDARKLLNMPEGHYTPGKIHGRLDLGGDGWLYYSTHRGSERVTTDAYNYKGDWILRCNPATGASEIAAWAPVPKHSIPCSVLDPKRMIFYGATAPPADDKNAGIQFFAYDIQAKKVLYSGPDGPARYMILAGSTGRVYFTPGQSDEPLMRFDPVKGGAPEKIPGKIGIRGATQETPDGIVYTVSTGQSKAEAHLYAFNVKTEAIEDLGPAAAGSQNYITTIDADPSGRFLYYIPGAHGGSERDGTPIVQFDVKTKQKKVIAFLHPFYQDKYGATLKGTFSAALDANGATLFISWNVSRGTRAWDSCALSVVHIPESERQ